MRAVSPGPAQPTRPPLRYRGGKWRIGPWIIGHFPPHTCYVEPFGGGAGVMLQKPPVDVEVWNDLDSNVVNFFRVLREYPEQLAEKISLTPWAREEFQLAYQLEQAKDPLEKARRFYVLAWQAMGAGTTIRRTGWRYGKVYRNSRWRSTKYWNQLEQLFEVAERLKVVQIENAPAIDVIERFDDPETLFYVDPPYVTSTRSDRDKNSTYRHELSDVEHWQLSILLHAVKGMVFLSGYRSELYAELYPDWRTVEKQTLNHQAQPTTETLWISPTAATAMERARGAE